MKFHKEQKRQLSDYLIKFSLALLTALLVRVFFGEEHISKVVYFVALVVVVGTLLLGLYLLPTDESKDTMTTEVKKGIFHISRAEIAH